MYPTRSCLDKSFLFWVASRPQWQVNAKKPYPMWVWLFIAFLFFLVEPQPSPYPVTAASGVHYH